MEGQAMKQAGHQDAGDEVAQHRLKMRKDARSYDVWRKSLIQQCTGSRACGRPSLFNFSFSKRANVSGETLVNRTAEDTSM
jgi:hypothetical protein